jgi:hypothetical protein
VYICISLNPEVVYPFSVSQSKQVTGVYMTMAKDAQKIIAYNTQQKWWKVEYMEDGDKEDLNFRQLCKLDIAAPDFSVFRYSQEGD